MAATLTSAADRPPNALEPESRPGHMRRVTGGDGWWLTTDLALYRLLERQAAPSVA
jgi:hypothetical protein